MATNHWLPWQHTARAITYWYCLHIDAANGPWYCITTGYPGNQPLVTIATSHWLPWQPTIGYHGNQPLVTMATNHWLPWQPPIGYHGNLLHWQSHYGLACILMQLMAHGIA